MQTVLFVAAVLATCFVATQSQACNKWCFTNKLCPIPEKNNCTMCLYRECAYDLMMNPFSNFLGVDCVKNEVKRGCKQECEVTGLKVGNKRLRKCKACLTSCLDKARYYSENQCGYMNGSNNGTMNPPPMSPCASCVNNMSCPTRMELRGPSMRLCLTYVHLKCRTMRMMNGTGMGNGTGTGMGMGDMEDREDREDMEDMGERLDELRRGRGDFIRFLGGNVTCIKEQFANPCSECPAWNPARFDACNSCLTSCHDKVNCARQCAQEGNYPVMLRCNVCASLCRVTRGDKATCMANKCPACGLCNACYNGCNAAGYAPNTCGCIQPMNPPSPSPLPM